VLTTGPSGSGKSSIARSLLGPLGAVRLRSDVERKRIAGLGAQERSDGDIYTAELTHRTYQRLEVLAAAALTDGFSVIVDAASLLAGERRRFRDLASRMAVPFRLLHLTADETTLRARVAKRAAEGVDASEATPEVLDRQLALLEGLDPGERELAVSVDTSDAVDVQALARRLAAAGVDGG